MSTASPRISTRWRRPFTPVRGISGAAVELIKIDDFSVLVSDFQGDAVPVNRDNALAHAAAVGSLLNETTPLPLRFGTVVGEQHAAQPS